MNPVVHYYEQYNEHARLTTDNSRRLEFITTTHLMDKYISKDANLLDLGAGTGIYSFYFAGKGCMVTSTDLTPKHVELIRATIAQEGLTNIVAEPADATDLSSYADESFDAVLCLGPMYHLKDRAAQLNCLRECTRVLRPGGIVGVAYVNRLFIYPHLVRMDQRYLTREWMDRILDKGEISASDSDCFWTDAYFHLPEEMEALCGECGSSVWSTRPQTASACICGKRLTASPRRSLRCGWTIIFKPVPSLLFWGQVIMVYTSGKSRCKHKI